MIQAVDRKLNTIPYDKLMCISEMTYLITLLVQFTQAIVNACHQTYILT